MIIWTRDSHLVVDGEPIARTITREARVLLAFWLALVILAPVAVNALVVFRETSR